MLKLQFIIKSILAFLILIGISSLNSCSSRPSDNICVLLKLSHCEGTGGRNIRRSSSQSIPSVSSASQFNPANVSQDKGFGTEIIYHFRQNPNFNFISGTGRVGAAFLSSQLENTFFSNHVPELEDDYFARLREYHYYKSKKTTFAGSFRLIGNRNIGMDLGLITKYNPEVRKINSGAGLALRLKFLTISSAFYRDDMDLNLTNKLNYDTMNTYSNIYNKQVYQESFKVLTMSAGINLKSLFLDAGVIKTHYDFYNYDQKITLYSATYIWDRLLFNYAQRTDELPRWYLENNIAKKQQVKKNNFGSIQATLGKSVSVAIQYNYYLLEELSTAISVFF